MKISLMLESQENLSWDALKRIAELIDNTKFYGLFLSDHLFSVKGTSDSFGLPVWPARVIQHETDHLDGILFLDRMKSHESLAFVEEYGRYWEKSES
tara:strand:+ start:304 stop:594 length:291 start_codon:yes stop_codon:yes gene_type:complete